MDANISITGRNGVEVPEHFKTRIEEKLPRALKYDPSIINVDVILKHYKNPKRAEEDSQVEITAHGSGHIARSEAQADNFYAALENAIEKLEGSLRKVKTQRETPKQGHRAPLSAGESARQLIDEINAEQKGDHDADPYADKVEFYEPGHVVRQKEVSVSPITVDEALSNMELVGHDFYLFINSENNKPSVVYRRHAFDYGLITLSNVE